jgi:GTP-binding protein
MITTDKIRNIAIIAHVDHGKTTLVDGLLKQSNTFKSHQSEMNQDLIMDSGDQEKQRGITITAKVTAVQYKDYRINIIDTPGHADFSGEVERVLKMADGVLLLVDAQEGPMPQTTFVLKKALDLNLTPLVLVNKIDKAAARISEVEDEVANLFLDLASNDAQLHYKTYYSIGRAGKAWDHLPADMDEEADLACIYDAIINEIPVPADKSGDAFQMQVTALQWDSYVGKYGIGRIVAGSFSGTGPVNVIDDQGTITKGKIEQLYAMQGLNKIQITEATCGDIIAFSGIDGIKISDTIADPSVTTPLPAIEVEAPTLKIYLGPNTSPMKGKEGEFTTSRQIAERLQKELETNIGLRVEDDGIGFLVSGRGELHLSVMIETMRREGFEFEVGKPLVVTKQEDGKTMEPVEEVFIEVPPEHSGAVQAAMGKRRAEMKHQDSNGKGGLRISYVMPTRALLGLRSELVSATKGTVIINSLLIGYERETADLPQIRNGVIIAFEAGSATPYALNNCEERGTLFVGPTEIVYAGQVVGLNARGDDIEMNVVREKKLTNMRSKGTDGTIQLTPATRLSLEECLDFLEADELLEVTPKSLRLRKRVLDHGMRKRS